MKTIKNTTERLITISFRISKGNSDLRTADVKLMSANVRKVHLHPGINDIDERDYDAIKELKFFDDLVTAGYLEIFGHSPSKTQIQLLNEQIEREKNKATELEKRLKELEGEKKTEKTNTELNKKNTDPKIVG